MIKVDRYSCRYLDKGHHVYAIRVSSRHLEEKPHIKDDKFYSVPFVNHQTKVRRNAMVGFICVQSCYEAADMVAQVTNTPCEPYETSLGELKDYAHSIHMPVVVVLNSYCMLPEKVEHYDIYYSGIDNDDIHALPPNNFN